MHSTPNVNLTKVWLTNTEKCSNPAGATVKLPGTLLRDPTTGNDMRRNALKSFANRRIKRLSQLKKVSTPCLEDHEFKKKELGTVGEVSNVLL